MTARKRPEDKLKNGRPTDYTSERGQRICHLIATHSHSLQFMCKLFDEFPENKSTIYDWLERYPDFSNSYAKAKAKQVDRHVEYCLELADNAILLGSDASASFVMALRLAVDTRKWYAAKLAPKLYGDKLQVEDNGDEKESLKKELVGLKKKLDKKNKKDY